MGYDTSKGHGLYDPSTEHDACGIGFVAHIQGVRSQSIIQDALDILCRLSHRGATGCDPETGDGAGILFQLPHRFFDRIAAAEALDLPRPGRYGVGQVFFPADPERRAACEGILEAVIEEEGQRLVGWRDVPVDTRHLGRIAHSVLPVIRQVFVARRRVVPSAFERKLYVIRKIAERRIREAGIDPDGRFHVCSLSAETLVYKGLLTPTQLPRFYPDLRDEDLVSAIAVVHSRFSTNTFPTWDLAQPFRYICHNGEINTLRGNRNWTTARRARLQSGKFGDIERLFPIIVPGGSDSGQFDNMLELMFLGGRSLPHALMMMIPEAWENHELMDDDRRAFYDYSASLLEPWDGPAAIAFTDGHLVGATLDRNGLRPARFVVTEDQRVVLASEVGALQIPARSIVRKGRLQPGRMLIVDIDAGEIIDDAEVKEDITGRFPYRRWLEHNQFPIEDLPEMPARPPVAGPDLQALQRAFGYTDEDLRILLSAMAESHKEPIGSMGSDTPLAVLSDRSPPLFHYFKQLFAQVTNPPIDPIRERLVMSLRTVIGGGGNTFEETPEACHDIVLSTPILTNSQLETVSAVQEGVGVFEVKPLPMLYEPSDPDALSRAVDTLCEAAVDAVDEGYSLLVLTDRDADARHAPIPALLALSAVHQALIREGTRMLSGLVVETAEAREIHHFATLIGFGAAAVNPWLALDTLRAMCEDGRLELTPDEAVAGYIKAVDYGLLKVMSKMGISTIESYRGAQIFECVGLDRELVDRHFTGTPSRLRGIGLRELDREVRERHARGFGPDAWLDPDDLPVGGDYQWRRRGERHKWNPATITRLQAAIQEDDEAIWAEYSRLATEESDGLATLRGMIEILPGDKPVPLSEVEPEEAIFTRFCTGAMSFGSISASAHETMAIAMNRLGGKSNTGEGGEEPARFTPDANGDLRRSAIKQVASARFGVHAEYLVNADELQIKIAQGAKPGEGGQLPGHKVSERIARVRCSTPGVTLISPPPHHDIYSIEDLAQLIYDLKTVNHDGRVSVKLVSEVGVGTIAAGVAKARADCVIVAGASGGTGASPLSSLKHAGLPWELGLAETQQVLVQNDLRSRIRVQVDGGLRTGRDVVVGALLGAEEFGFSTAPLVSLGCVLLRKCHLNTCSVGIATQDPELEERFAGDPAHVERFFRFVAREVRQWMAKLGFRTFDEMVGRVDRLRTRTDVDHWKARSLDLSMLLAEPDAPESVPRRQTIPQADIHGDHLDRTLIARVGDAITREKRVEIAISITNADRAVGAMLSGAVARVHGAAGLPDDTIDVRFTGCAGQSFGAFLARGVSFHLEGDANDYFGKGLSGGRLVAYPPRDSRLVPEDNVIIGNTALYGATSGQAFVRGQGGERFAVRNSGAQAVIEGVGDHGCEYMTGGVVVVLGPTGRNCASQPYLKE